MAVVELSPDEVEDHPSTPSHPAGKVTAFDEKSGLPIVRRDLHSGTVESEEKGHGTPRDPVRSGEGRKDASHAEGDHGSAGGGAHGASEPDRQERNPEASDGAGKKLGTGSVHGREVLHQSTDRAELVTQAKAHAKQFEDGLKSATRGIAGAKFDDVRPEKNPARIDEKVNDEQQPIETIPDILAGRIGVDSPEAHEKTAAAIGNHFKVVRDEDEFEKGDPEYGYRVHKMQVQVTPQLSGEVHIVPKEVLEVNDEQHESYKAARDAEVDGDDKDASKMAAKAKKINDAAMAKFNERNGVKSENVKEERKESPEQPAGAETKYKFGSTQVNLPPESDAHKSITSMQGKIPKEHFANDGTEEEADKPHVTVRYGVKGDDTQGIKDYISKQAPFEARLGKTKAFPVSEHSDGAAPVVASVESPELHRIHEEIAKHGDFAPSSFPEYKPHVTVGYIKPEHAQKYVGMADGEGKTFPVKSIAIGDRNGNHEEVLLKGNGDAKSDKAVVPSTQGRSDTASRFSKKEASAQEPAKDAGRAGEASAGSVRDGKLSGRSGPTDKTDAASVRRDGGARDAGSIQRNPKGESGSASANRTERGPDKADTGGSHATPVSGAGGGRGDAAGTVSNPKFAKGQTVLVGDSHGIIRGGNPNFAQGGRWSVETPEGVKTVKGSELTAVVPMKPKPDTEWDAYDLDKTLAVQHGAFKGPNVIGKPIPAMVDQVKADIKDGKQVRIFTARVADDPKGIARAAIEAWSQRVFGAALPVTNIKDHWMRNLWDDRAHTVEANTGKVLA